MSADYPERLTHCFWKRCCATSLTAAVFSTAPSNKNQNESMVVLVVVYATMRNVSKGEALVEAAGRALGRTLEIKQLDVCDEDSIKACVDSLPERRVDILSKSKPFGSMLAENRQVELLVLQICIFCVIFPDSLDFLSQ